MFGNWQQPWKSTALVALALIIAGAGALGGQLMSGSDTTSAAEHQPALENIQPYVRVQSRGRATAAPDEAMIEFGVTTRAEQAKEAVEQNAAAAERVMQSLKDAGISQEALQTSRYSLREAYETGKEGRDRVPIGFIVTNRVQVTTQNLDELGRLIDTATQAGANQVNSLRFQLSEPAAAAAESEALQEAMIRAQQRAEALTAGSNTSLGSILSIDEVNRSQPPVIMREAQYDTASMAAGSTPVNPGQLDVSVQLNVVYELDR